MPHIIPITDNLPLHTAWLTRAEPLHRQLRPQLPATYETYLRQMFAEGAEMAVLATAETIHAIAVYRVHHTTYQGLRFYIDDLVTDEATRSQGHGTQILAWCEARARARNCNTLALDSGVQRTRAHKFYFRENLVITGYNFNKPLQ